MLLSFEWFGGVLFTSTKCSADSAAGEQEHKWGGFLWLLSLWWNEKLSSQLRQSRDVNQVFLDLGHYLLTTMCEEYVILYACL